MKKWSPLTVGMPQHDAELTAWIMEREAKALQELQESGAVNKMVLGRWLKYVFPTLRRSAPQFTVLDRLAFDGDDKGYASRIHSIITDEFQLVLEAEVAGITHPPEVYTPGEEPDVDQLFVSLAERTAESIKLYEG